MISRLQETANSAPDYFYDKLTTRQVQNSVDLPAPHNNWKPMQNYFKIAQFVNEDK